MDEYYRWFGCLKLTAEQEKIVVRLVKEGQDIKQVARRFEVGPATVRKVLKTASVTVGDSRPELSESNRNETHC